MCGAFQEEWQRGIQKEDLALLAGSSGVGWGGGVCGGGGEGQRPPVVSASGQLPLSNPSGHLEDGMMRQRSED